MCVWQEAELEKAKGLLSRFKNDHMTRLLDLLDIPRSDLKDKVRTLLQLQIPHHSTCNTPYRPTCNPHTTPFATPTPPNLWKLHHSTCSCALQLSMQKAVF